MAGRSGFFLGDCPYCNIRPAGLGQNGLYDEVMLDGRGVKLGSQTLSKRTRRRRKITELLYYAGGECFEAFHDSMFHQVGLLGARRVDGCEAHARSRPGLG